MKAALPRHAAVLSMAVLGALLVGCATPPTAAPGEPPWTSGRLSVNIAATATQGSQGMSASFELRGSGDAGELRLNTALGTRLATARWSPALALLITPDGERRFDNLDELSRQAVGETLPLAALPDWLSGRPWPGAAHRNTDSGFEQLGWAVSLAQRGQGLIEARRDAPPAVRVRVRLEAD